MTALDTVKLDLQPGTIKATSRSKTQTVQHTYRNGQEDFKTTVDVLNRPCLGITSVSRRPDGSGLIELSSKVLGKDYLRMITADSLDQVIDCLNNGEAVHVDSDLFKQSEILKADFTCDTRPGIVVDELVESLSTFDGITGYSVQTYKTAIVFTRLGADGRTKERQIQYSKFDDLIAGKNRQLCDHMGPVAVDSTKGIWRVETNVRSFAKLREYTGLKERGLVDVLTRSDNVALKVFDKITKCDRNILFEYLTEYKGTWLELIKRKGWYSVWIEVEGSIGRCFDAIRLVSKGRNRHQEDEARLWFGRFEAEKNGTSLLSLRKNTVKAIRDCLTGQTA